MKSFTTSDAIEASRFVVLDGEYIKTAAASTDNIIGVSETVNADEGDVMDVYIPAEWADIEAGGTFSEGDALTSNSEGRAVKASSGDNIGAIAMSSAVENDIVPCIVTLQRTISDTTDSDDDTTDDTTDEETE